MNIHAIRCKWGAGGEGISHHEKQSPVLKEAIIILCVLVLSLSLNVRVSTVPTQGFANLPGFSI